MPLQGALAAAIRFPPMPVYRILRFEGSLLTESMRLEAGDHISAAAKATEMRTSDRLELWLDDRQVAILLPSRAGQHHH